MLPSTELVAAFGTVPLQPREPSALVQLLGAGIGLTVAVAISGVLAVVIASLAPKLTDESLRKCRDDGVVAFFAGLGATVLVPIVLAILAVTVIGLVVAIPGFIVLFVVLLVGSAIGVLLVGRSVLGAVSSSAGEPDTLVVAFAGALVLVAVSLIPVLGGLVNFVVSTVGVGAVSLVLWDRYR